MHGEPRDTVWLGDSYDRRFPFLKMVASAPIAGQPRKGVLLCGRQRLPSSLIITRAASGYTGVVVAR